MPAREILDSFLPPLLSGKRQDCRHILAKAMDRTKDARQLYNDVLWPAMMHVEALFREDRINLATEHMATRITRCLADQLQAHLPRRQWNGKRIVITCADGEPEELGAQICADLFESDGWDAYFIGGGVPNDEILALVGELRPDILLVFGTQPQGIPLVRRLIDLIREVAANPRMNIMISGGVFNRAAGLWEEINADLFAPCAEQALAVANKAEPRTPTIRVPGAPKKRRRRRRPPLLAQLEASA